MFELSLLKYFLKNRCVKVKHASTILIFFLAWSDFGSTLRLNRHPIGARIEYSPRLYCVRGNVTFERGTQRTAEAWEHVDYFHVPSTEKKALLLFFNCSK